MFHPYEFFLALRYLLAGKFHPWLSLVSVIAVCGLSLGICALIVVLSVMNGFERELRTRILDMVAHANLWQVDGALQDWSSTAEELRDAPEVLGSAPFVEQQGMLMHRGQIRGALLRGVLPEREQQVSRIAGHMVEGDLALLRPGSYGVVLGSRLAAGLRVSPGDAVTLLAPSGFFNISGFTPRLKRLRVLGVFSAGMYSYDNGLAYVHMQDAARVFRRPGPDGLRLLLRDPLRAPLVVARLNQELKGRGYLLQDWTEWHRGFFSALRTEKRVMSIILALIIAVAVFNIVSIMVMTVDNKRAAVAVLRTMGARRGGILALFLTQGMMIALAGSVLGTLGGGAAGAPRDGPGAGHRKSPGPGLHVRRGLHAGQCALATAVE